ncbi:holin [Oceanobacillus oncorhynchi]|uniref:holin n=1 Tax=Oceanobacillus TaxID=182709 RepID=UPI0021167022|nr:holin [Oceanobacillus oncorhynchi]UUI41194.1 holin [Oceanobacillus oncorhynchi]
MQEILVLATLLAPIITGVVQALKVGFTIKKNLLPFVAVITGILLGYMAWPFSDIEAVSRVWAGGMAGLASVGLFELGNQRQGETKE